MSKAKEGEHYQESQQGCRLWTLFTEIIVCHPGNC